MPGNRWSFPRLAAQSDEMLRLDALRIIASLAIVIYHFKADLDVRGMGLWLVKRLDGLHVAVDLFFFISGFVISRYYGTLSDARDYGRFLWKRLARLYPLHFATTIVFVAIGMGAPLAGLSLRYPDQFDLRCLPANLALVHSLATCPNLSFNDPSWSISAEMMMYLCWPLVLVLLRRPPVALAVGLMLLAVIALRPGADGRPWTEWSYDFGAARAAPSFLLGAVAHAYRAPLARIPFAEPAMWAVLLATGVLMLLGTPGTALVLMLYVVALLGIAADGNSPASRVVKALAPWGALTFSLYLIHMLVDIGFNSLLARRLLHLSGWALDLWVVMTIGVSVAIAYASFFFFESPSRAWLSGLPSRRRRQTALDLRSPL